MSERATAYRIPPPATASASSELAVRPKVLRRPAHFNARTTNESPTPMLIPLYSEPHAVVKTTPAFRAWQDDGKFAITLLALVILVNLALSAWLSAIAPVESVTPMADAPLVDAVPAIHVLDGNARDISEQ